MIVSLRSVAPILPHIPLDKGSYTAKSDVSGVEVDNSATREGNKYFEQ